MPAYRGKMNIIKTMILILILVVIVVVIFWVGMSVWANFFRTPEGAMPDMPDIKKATYSVLIKNTGNLLLTDEYEHYGNIYILKGYWELTGQKWEYRKSQLVLDEQIFGKIEVKRRE